MPTTCFHYDPGACDPGDLFVSRGGVQQRSIAGRRGVLLDDVHGGIVLGPHHLAEPRGSIAIWVCALEDLHGAHFRDHHNHSMAHANEFVLLSDRETVREYHCAHAALVFSTYWHPGLFMKRCPGGSYQSFKEPRHGMAASGHFWFEAGSWYQIVYSWDAPADRHRLFVNGVLVGHSDSKGRPGLAVATPGPELCIGSTMFCTGPVTGYVEELDEAACATLFTEQCDQPDANLQARLRRTFRGEDLPSFQTPGDAGWQTRWDLSLTAPDHLRRFLVQGCPDAARITPEGLRITTPTKDPSHSFDRIDLSHVYLWSREWFEGDWHLSYEFSPKRPGGLSLLMTRCSGMQREDIWTSHPPRTDGIMRPVCWEDVRNYHWEYYREMDDVRNDLASHAMLKNPWQCPIGFGIHGPTYAVDSWHRLDYLQIGGRIIGAIDGAVVIDGVDRPDSNNGPILSGGRFAIRCMTRTDLLLRDLRMRTRDH